MSEFKEEFRISITTKKELSEKEINQIKNFFVSRLQGYSIECPDVLNDSNLLSSKMNYIPNKKKIREDKLNELGI